MYLCEPSQLQPGPRGCRAHRRGAPRARRLARVRSTSANIMKYIQ